jgi:hypothetical protein
VASPRTCSTGDVANLRRLLAWAKKEGLAITRAKVGDVEVDLVHVMPTRIVHRDTKPGNAARPGIYDEIGGGILDKLQGEHDENATFMDEEQRA